MSVGTDRPVAGGPLWFGRPDHPLFGWVHPPPAPGTDGAGRSVVVLCPPLFADQAAAHPVYRTLAGQLAAAGIWVVRFDYRGTGDSGGVSRGGDGVTGWLASVDQAMELARTCTDGPLGLVGMRMGALLAALAAERRSDVDALALWDPCLSGRTFVHQQQALQALRFPATGADEVIEVPGDAIDATLAERLVALRLPTTLSARRALVLLRPGRAQPTLQLADRGTGSAAAPEVASTGPREQEALLEVEPMLRRLPTVTTDRVVQWLGAALATRPEPAPTRPDRRVVGSIERPATAPDRPPEAAGSAGNLGTPGLPVAATTWVEMPAGSATGTPVRERVVPLGSLGLFGIETDSTAIEGADDRPLVVFLSSGTDTHVGPSRLWVRLARRWAAAGDARCIRVDLSGWGESPPRPGRPEQVLRTVEAFDEVLDIATAADRRRLILVGLCSGAYQALESALELRPGGVLAVNPLLRFTPPELVETGVVSSRRRICVPKKPWIGSIRRRLPRCLIDTVVTVRTAASRVRSSRRVEGWLGELVQADVRVYCVCGEDEARPLLQASPRSRASWWSSGHVRIDVVPGLDHALLPMAQREAVCERLTDELHRIAEAWQAGAGAEHVVLAELS